jgi:lytic murein transglycosylase
MVMRARLRAALAAGVGHVSATPPRAVRVQHSPTPQAAYAPGGHDTREMLGGYAGNSAQPRRTPSGRPMPTMPSVLRRARTYKPTAPAAVPLLFPGRLLHRLQHHRMNRRLLLRLAPRLAALLAPLLALVLAAAPARSIAGDCGEDAAGFESWLAGFKVKAAQLGISPPTIAAALGDVTYDANVIRLDRSQRSFKLSFEEFYARRVGSALIRRGQALMRTHRATLDRIEARFGVPAPILISIWGLETNYGADSSSRFSIIRSLATLAYDCRRSPFFTPHLLDALRIVDRGDMTPGQLRGGWAGEIGQTQFLPSIYVQYAVDFDGDGHPDLVNSVPDILASTANFLQAHGWQAGQSWEPDTHNYAVIKEWNKAEVYQRTIAIMANKLREGA